MTADLVTLSVEEHVATLTLNRPERRNAFNLAMIDEWVERLGEASAAPDVRVIVVTGAGRGFCAGGDVDEMVGFAEKDALERKNFLWEHVHRVPLTLWRMDKPVIAAVHGAARGAGMDMALMCDLRIAARSATFAESYINMGLVAGDGGGWFLPRLVGSAKALELFWTGRAVDAEEAERLGIVNRVVDDADVLPQAYRLAREIAGQPQLAVRYFKRLTRQAATQGLEEHLDMVSSHMAVLEDTEDHRAKLRAFINRAR